jgi:hypothetical protein
MSLLLNGAKTMTIAGTEMQCLEIYTGEAYTFPINFKDQNGNAANANVPNLWSITASAKYYTVDTVTYNASNTEVTLGNLNYDPNTQPNANAYTLVTNWSNSANGTAYLYVGDNITGSGNGTPNIGLANSAANSVLFLVTLTVSKESLSNSSLTDVNREPLGFIVRYQ